MTPRLYLQALHWRIPVPQKIPLSQKFLLRLPLQQELVFEHFDAAHDFDRIDVVVAEVGSDLQSVIRGRGKTKSSPITDHGSLGTQIPRALDIGKGLIRILTADRKFILLSTKSACPSAMMACACAGSVIRPTAIVVTPVVCLICCANGTW